MARRALVLLGCIGMLFLTSAKLNAEWYDDCPPPPDGSAPPLIGYAMVNYFNSDTVTVNVHIDTDITIDATSIGCGVKHVYDGWDQQLTLSSTATNMAAELGRITSDVAMGASGAAGAATAGAAIESAAAGASVLGGGGFYTAVGGIVGGPLGMAIGAIVGIA